VDVSLRVLQQDADWSALRPAWDEIVDSQSASILGPDVTCTSTWTEVLWENHLKRQKLEALVGESHGRIDAILPFYRVRKTVHFVPCRSLVATCKLYDGRGGFVLRNAPLEGLAALLAGLKTCVSGWDVFFFTLVENSSAHNALLQLENRRGFRLEKVESHPSPYFLMNTTWEEYFAALQNRFRGQLRKFEKRARAAGDLTYKVFESGPDLDYFYDSVRQIERQSWKEKAGTSLTANEVQDRFHARIMHAAADRGWMSGHLLELNGEPIAYQFGLIYNGVFYDLKGSFKDQFREIGAGRVMYRLLIEELFRRKVAIFDFQGVCHDFKMRLTDKTYRTSTYLLYNDTLAAHAARLAGYAARFIPAKRSAPQENHEPNVSSESG
jgi:hypothetical protein